MTVFYLPHLNMRLKLRFSKITFTDDQMLKILRALDNKAHGHEEISIRMLKLCDKSIIKPLDPYCSRIVLIQGLFQTLGRSQILCLFTKKGTSR